MMSNLDDGFHNVRFRAYQLALLRGDHPNQPLKAGFTSGAPDAG